MTILPDIKPENLKLDDVKTFILSITDLALFVAGALAVIYILIGGFWYFTAYGNEEKANKGKTTLMWAIGGIIVILLSRVTMATLKNLIM